MGRLSLCAPYLYVIDADNDPLAENSRCPGNCVKAHGHIPGIEQTVKLRSAGVELFRHCLLGLVLFLHRLLKLPGKYSFDCHSFDLFSDSFFFEKTIEARSAVVTSFCHD